MQKEVREKGFHAELARSWDPQAAVCEVVSTHLPLSLSDLQKPPGVSRLPFSAPRFPHFQKGVLGASPGCFLGLVAKADDIKYEMIRGQSGQASHPSLSLSLFNPSLL